MFSADYLHFLPKKQERDNRIISFHFNTVQLMLICFYLFTAITHLQAYLSLRILSITQGLEGSVQMFLPLFVWNLWGKAASFG